MKLKKSLWITALSLTATASAAFAQAPAANPPGYLPEFKYQVSSVTAQEAQALMDTENHDTTDHSICANRAEMWSFMMNREKQVQVGKVFIHFTPKGQADENGEWAYHVSPYVIVDGKEMVLDGGFDEFHRQPAKLSDWTNYFGKSPNCVVLDPINNPADLALEQNDLPNDNVDPITYSKGGARQYPTPPGTTCYIRKVPMYYVFPMDVYGADLALAGQSKFDRFLETTFNPQDVLASCNQALGFFTKLKRSCSDYLGIPKH